MNSFLEYETNLPFWIESGTIYFPCHLAWPLILTGSGLPFPLLIIWDPWCWSVCSVLVKVFLFICWVHWSISLLSRVATSRKSICVTKMPSCHEKISVHINVVSLLKVKVRLHGALDPPVLQSPHSGHSIATRPEWVPLGGNGIL